MNTAALVIFITGFCLGASLADRIEHHLPGGSYITQEDYSTLAKAIVEGCK